MKRLVITVLSIFTMIGVSYGVGGSNTSLTVSSGTFLAIDGYTNNNGNFRQVAAIGDSSTTFTLGINASSSAYVNFNGQGQPITSTSTIIFHSDSNPSTQNITIQDTGSTSSGGANGATMVTGSPTAGSVASFSVASFDTAKIQVSGTWTGTLTPELSFDSGTTWVSQGFHQVGTVFTVGNSTANFVGGTNVSGTTNFRIRATAAMTGTAVVKVNLTLNPNSFYLANSPSLIDGLGTSSKMQVTSSNAAKVDGSAVTQPVSIATSINVQGPIASSTTVSGNPVLNGAVASSTTIGAVGYGSIVNLKSDQYGRLRTTGVSVTVAGSSGTAITSAGQTTVISAPAAGTHLRIKYLAASNSGATSTKIGFENGAAGLTVFESFLPQNGIFAHNLAPDYWDLSSATALILNSSAAGNVYWTIEYELVSD